MSFEVFRLQVFPCEDNRYGVGRAETLQLQRDKVFATESEAVEHIYNSTVIHVPEFGNLAYGLQGEQRVAFAQAFCFDDDRYLKYRRFFLGIPDTKAMGKAYKSEGVRVVQG